MKVVWGRAVVGSRPVECWVPAGPEGVWGAKRGRRRLTERRRRYVRSSGSPKTGTREIDDTTRSDARAIRPPHLVAEGVERDSEQAGCAWAAGYRS